MKVTAKSTSESEFWNPHNRANIGKPRAGGYFAGVITQSDGDYELIVAPKTDKLALDDAATRYQQAGTEEVGHGDSGADFFASFRVRHKP